MVRRSNPPGSINYFMPVVLRTSSGQQQCFQHPATNQRSFSACYFAATLSLLRRRAFSRRLAPPRAASRRRAPVSVIASKSVAATPEVAWWVDAGFRGSGGKRQRSGEPAPHSLGRITPQNKTPPESKFSRGLARPFCPPAAATTAAALTPSRVAADIWQAFSAALRKLPDACRWRPGLRPP